MVKKHENVIEIYTKFMLTFMLEEIGICHISPSEYSATEINQNCLNKLIINK